ncbi:hypothetical protein IT568_05470 [bacterium]|nr:hypothetical protein [bacterium]
MKKIIYLLLLVVLTSCEVDEKTYVGLGWSAFEKQDYESATKNFETALSRGESEVEANTGLGWVNLKQENFDASLEKFNIVLNLDVKFTDALSGIGILYSKTAKFSSSTLILEKLFELDSNYSFNYDTQVTEKNLRLLLAQDFFLTGDYEKSANQLAIILGTNHSTNPQEIAKTLASFGLGNYN